MDAALTAAAIGVGGTVIVGIAGFWASVRNTNKLAGLTEQGQLTDRYSKAVGQLGSEKLDVRIGGIYALERIARDSPRDHPTIMEVLSAFIREHSHEQWPPAEPGAEPTGRTTRPDVQAAVTVIGRRTVRYDSQPVNLQEAELEGADLTGADLTGADLHGARLTGAYFKGAHLDSAHLSDAVLWGAQFNGADLSGADLLYANLNHASLIRARLNGADLTGAHLENANLDGADLTGADLEGAYVDGVYWPADRPVPEGWQRDTHSDRLMRVARNPGDAAAE
jgi:hypothetical protein